MIFIDDEIEFMSVLDFNGDVMISYMILDGNGLIDIVDDEGEVTCGVICFYRLERDRMGG